MSTYLALVKFLPGEHDITIYESRDTHSNRDNVSENLNNAQAVAPQGGAIGISANGMRTLKSLDPAVHKMMQERGFPYDTLRLRSLTGWDLSVVSRMERADDVTMIMARQIAWQTLREAIPDGKVVYKKAVKVTKKGQSGNSKPQILVADGESKEFDLVVGADGVHSTVRKQFFSDTSFDSSAVFSQRCGIWGFMAMPIPKEVTESKSVVIVLGDGASMGYSAYRPTVDDSLTWWSLYETKEPPNQKEVPREFVSGILQSLYGNWREENVREGLKSASAPFIYPIWTVSELPTWGDGGVVLVGDAPHAMTPDIGQGTSQAFEDSEAFRMFLGRALQNDSLSEADAIDLAVRGLYESRQPRVSRIKLLNAEAQAQSKNVKRIAWVQTFIFCCIWIMPKLAWIRDLLYGGGHKTDGILYGWDVEEETRRVIEKRSISTSAHKEK